MPEPVVAATEISLDHESRAFCERHGIHDYLEEAIFPLAIVDFSGDGTGNDLCLGLTPGMCDGSVLERTAGSAVFCAVENGKGKAAEAGNRRSCRTQPRRKPLRRRNKGRSTSGAGLRRASAAMYVLALPVAAIKINRRRPRLPVDVLRLRRLLDDSAIQRPHRKCLRSLTEPRTTAL